MADKLSKKNPQKMSKGQRTHVRRLKQAARKEAINLTNSPRSGTVQPVVVPKKQDQS
jgi:hypothetical protein